MHWTSDGQVSRCRVCRAFSALSNLQQLHIGIVKHVTGDAFAEGLVRRALLLCIVFVWSRLTS